MTQMTALQQTVQARQMARRRSLLVPWGAVLVALAFLVPRPLSAAASEMSGGIRTIAFLATDVFRLGFFVGITFLIIGRLRNRRWKRAAKAAEREAPPPAARAS